MTDGGHQFFSTGKPMQIFVPFFVKHVIKSIRAWNNAEFCHNIWIEKVIFKGVIFQDQDIFLCNPWQMVDITAIPFIIIAAELTLQHIRVFAVTITNHQEAVFQINLVDVFQIGIGLDIGAAVGGDDGYTGRFAFIIVYFGVIFSQQQRKSAFVLAAFDNKYKIDIHHWRCIPDH